MQARLRILMAAVGLLLALTNGARAQQRLITFDDVPSGTVVNTTYSGVTFTGQGVPRSFFAPVQVTNLETPTNALDATLSTVLVTFSPATYGSGVRAFSFDVFGTFDSTGRAFGSTAAPVFLTDVFGNSRTFFVNETSSAGLHYDFGTSGIRSALLPADAYFDNISFQAVPEPNTARALGIAALIVGALAWRQKRRV